jgi:uncharacterized protein (DUF58 family)
VAPREYRHGDDLRRVHWRSTARHGELMVRREEQQWQSRGTLFLDTRRSVHRGEGPGSSFEQAVSAAASIGVHLSRAGFGLRFVTDSGPTAASLQSHFDGAFEGVLLDALATVQLSANRSLTAGLATLSGAGRDGDGLIIAVFAELDPAEARTVAVSRRGTATCVAVLVDVTGTGHFKAAAELLRASGWRVMTIGSAADLATAWARADQAGEAARLSRIRGGT